MSEPLKYNVNSTLRRVAASITNNTKVTVEFNSETPMTDGDTIFLPYLEYKVSSNVLDEFIFYITHESAHIIYTPFSRIQTQGLDFKQYPDTCPFIIKFLINLYEDIRVETCIQEPLPGIAYYLSRYLSQQRKEVSDPVDYETMDAKEILKHTLLYIYTLHFKKDISDVENTDTFCNMSRNSYFQPCYNKLIHTLKLIKDGYRSYETTITCVKEVLDLISPGLTKSSQNGDPQNGDPQNGDPQNGDPQNGDPQNGDPQNGDPQNGDPQNGDTKNGDTKSTVVMPGSNEEIFVNPLEITITNILGARSKEGQKSTSICTGGPLGTSVSQITRPQPLDVNLYSDALSESYSFRKLFTHAFLSFKNKIKRRHQKQGRLDALNMHRLVISGETNIFMTSKKFIQDHTILHLCLDISVSMQGAPIHEVRKLAIGIDKAAQLTNIDFSISLFNHGYAILKSKDEMLDRQKISYIAPCGATELHAAMLKSAQYIHQDSSKRKIIFVVTDGELKSPIHPIQKFVQSFGIEVYYIQITYGSRDIMLDPELTSTFAPNEFSSNVLTKLNTLLVKNQSN